VRILLIMDPLIPVPPEHYGGIERVIADVADGLAQRGHELTLWAGPGSRIAGVTETFGRPGEWNGWSNVRNVSTISARLLRDAHRFDVIHNFGRLAYLTVALSWRTPKVQTYMRTVNPANMRKVHALGGRHVCFTAVSAAIRDTGLPGGGDWRVIYNCASPDTYAFQNHVDATRAPLVFLGRLERCKGAHTAIEVATRLGRELLIAGNVSTLPHEREYFEREVAPRIDGRRIRYVGVVNDRQKNDLLGRCAAMLMPIEWEEPFPVVLPEALLCGAPVIAFRRGGVPEGIDHGRTGFLCDTVDDMVNAVNALPSIERAECRAEAERRFSTTSIVTEYETLYQGLRTAADQIPF
jgi:glycosyltransferase involved in cell wall biosynthesis